MKTSVTGAFGYSGRYIAARLLAAGHQVMTLTNSTERENPFGNRIKAFPFHFENPALLRQSLQGIEVLINTYWVRFDSRHFSHAEAVSNTKILFRAAKDAGVSRIIHASITNPDATSDLPYFRGKAELEHDLMNLGVSYCILRPTVLFGKEDILINNIAWSIRHLPVFGMFGKGDYRLQPIYVDDLALAAVQKAPGKLDEVVNAIGPETFTYYGLVRAIRAALGRKTPIVKVPPRLGYWMCRLLGLMVRDVIITPEEIRGLMENRLWVPGPALGTTALTDWLKANRANLGAHYASELGRRSNRLSAYSSQ